VVARAASRLAGRRVPLVWTPHTSLAEELPTYLPARLHGRGAAAAAWAGAAVDRAVAARVDAAVVLSRRAADPAREAGIGDVTVVPPGVDPAELVGGDAARARARWLLGERPWVVYTGTTDAFQDLDGLVRAMAEVPTAGLLVVTGGPTDALQAEAARAGLPASRLRVVRSTAFVDTLDAIAAATVGVVPRRVCAGFPMKVLNLLGAGRAVVAMAGSAPPIEGVLPVHGDAHALAGALRAAVADPASTARLGDAGRRAVLARWTWAARAAELEAVYARVAGGRG
jgi:glycosyltransferase involved in cell wall biosynthesis